MFFTVEILVPLYNGAFKAMLTTKPETSLTREISAKYDFSKNISFGTTAYRGSVSDVLNRSNSSGGYNETIDINQEGLESNLSFKETNKTKVIKYFFKKYRSNGRPQLRRPDEQYGINYNAKLNSNLIGLFGVNLNYRHVGKAEDWVGSVRKDVDSTDIMNLSISKELFGFEWSLNSTNLLDEYYQKPYGYNQERRNFNLSLRSKY